MTEGSDNNNCDPKTKMAVLKERINNFITTDIEFKKEIKEELIAIKKSQTELQLTLPCKERCAQHTERFKWLDRNVVSLWGITGVGIIGIVVAFLKHIFK